MVAHDTLVYRYTQYNMTLDHNMNMDVIVDCFVFHNYKTNQYSIRGQNNSGFFSYECTDIDKLVVLLCLLYKDLDGFLRVSYLSMKHLPKRCEDIMYDDLSNRVYRGKVTLLRYFDYDKLKLQTISNSELKKLFDMMSCVYTRF